MKIPFEFGHTCMNNFVVLDFRGKGSPSMETLSDLGKKFCMTTLADNLLVLQVSEIADARLRIMGGDGREADFCGNGVTYISAKIGQERGIDEVRIESASGVKTAKKYHERWKIEIGKAILLKDVAAKIPSSALKGESIFGLIRAGEPHLVVTTPESYNEFHLSREKFEDYCRPLRDITDIEGGVSITMVFKAKNNMICIRTFERGANRQTLSCGTGSVSAAAALYGPSSLENIFEVFSPGGSHKVIFDENKWYLMAHPQRIGSGYLEESTIKVPLDSLLAYGA